MSLLKYHDALAALVLSGLVCTAGSASALTIDITADNTTLSAAVAAVTADDNDGEDIINIHVDALTTPDGQIFIDQPLTINGDADNNGTQCDILVDMTGILNTQNIGPDNKGYIEIQTAGLVSISNLKIHPNADGLFSDVEPEVVSGIRTFKPALGESGQYNFTKVYVSGSDGLNNHAYVSLETGADLFNQEGIERWGGIDAGDGSIAGFAAIQLTNQGDGTYDATLDHCHGGLSRCSALNIPTEGGIVEVLGGIYGHCGRDGIRVSGTGVTLQGTHDDRLRIVRNSNISGRNSHGVEVVAGGDIVLMEYVDVASLTTANLFNFRNGHLGTMRFCRGLGKLDDGIHESVYLNSSMTIDRIEDCTIVGGGVTGVPVGATKSFTGPASFVNSIFTSVTSTGTLVVNTSGFFSLTNCALPTDGFASESLATEPIEGLSSQTITVNSPIHSSPHYLLTLADYDWSAAQGDGKPGNGAGNVNVLRPSSPDYQTAATNNMPLNGGAGAPASGIDPSMWMLMP